MEAEKDIECPSTPKRRPWVSIWIPFEDEEKSKDQSCVLHDSETKRICELLKRNSHSRFLKFETEEEAFASLKEEKEAACDKEEEEEEGLKWLDKSVNLELAEAEIKNKNKGRLSLPALNKLSISGGGGSKMVGEEKDTRFPTPKTQELSALGREITAKMNDAVMARIAANPKVLVTDVDLPTMVHEGCRYNALHLAAKSNNHQMIAYILKKVASWEYLKLLYPNKSSEAYRELMRYVTDAYLNTPDKFANETPLHFATKFMCVEAAEVLIRHPFCNREVVNSIGLKPREIIGERVPTAQDYSAKKIALERLFDENFILPIWRQGSSVRMPVVGPVADFRQLGVEIPPPLIEKYFSSLEIEILGSCAKQLMPEATPCKRAFDYSNWQIKAFAGPATKEAAEELLRLFRFTRIGGLQSPIGTPVKSQMFHSPIVGTPPSHVHAKSQLFNSLCLTPPRANSLSSPFGPSPMFRAGVCTPPSSPMKSLRMAGSPLPGASSPATPEFMQRMKDIEKGTERHLMKLAKTAGMQWAEEWDEMDYYGDVTSPQGLKIVEQRLLENEDVMKRSLENEPELWGVAVSDLDGDSGDSFMDAIDEAIFLQRDGNPGKVDFQVYDVLKDYMDQISFNDYPMVFQWLNCMKSTGFSSYNDAKIKFFRHGNGTRGHPAYHF